MTLCSVDNCFAQSFGKDRLTRLPYCSKHQYKRTDLKGKKSSFDRAVEKKKAQNQKSNVNSKVRGLINTEGNKLVQNQAAEDYAKMEAWFDEFAKIIEADPYCDECRSFIPKRFYRAASAHCLPKRKEYGFPSVKLHPDNRLKLGQGCGCHKHYDNTWEEAAQMKIWPKAVAIFLILYPHIAKSEYKNIPEVLLQELPPKN